MVQDRADIQWQLQPARRKDEACQRTDMCEKGCFFVVCRRFHQARKGSANKRNARILHGQPCFRGSSRMRRAAVFNEFFAAIAARFCCKLRSKFSVRLQ